MNLEICGQVSYGNLYVWILCQEKKTNLPFFLVREGKNNSHYFTASPEISTKFMNTK